MRNFILLFIIGLSTLIYSCRSDFEFERSAGGLKFSKETVYLDTVFTNIGSSTYTLKVYNRSDKDIRIPTIQLGRGQDSKYRITIDGMQGNNGKSFTDVEMLAKDSLFIFIETTASITDANPTDFLYTDQIQFDSGANQQTVELVTLVQDAVFLYPKQLTSDTYESILINGEETYGFVLDEDDPVNGNEYEFTDEKPYVIYGFAAVASGKTLNIAPGARIHCHADSGIIVDDGASINAIGEHSVDPLVMENQIIFEGDRLEPGFADTPGQWIGILLTPGSTGNFKNTTIENAVVGLLIDSNLGTVNITDTQIYDCANYGILAREATIVGRNVVINSAGQATFAGTLGGSYDFRHCTFNNNWSSSQQVAVLLNNYDGEPGDESIHPLTHAYFANCIIFGSNQVELLLDKAGGADDWPTEPIFHKCQIRFNNTNNQFTGLAEYQFLNDASEILKNGNPRFFNANRNDLRISLESDAAASNPNFQGDPAITAEVPADITGLDRAGIPDLGAYKAVPEED
ncbi:MAG TPA: hypothetical protein VF676_00900 [Flavobacterium sp.]|jgi:hypothetical protein